MDRLDEYRMDIHLKRYFWIYMSCNLKRREHPGAGVESPETTVQMVDDQQFHFQIQDGGRVGGRLGYWMLTYVGQVFQETWMHVEGKDTLQQRSSGWVPVYTDKDQ
ncbi:uncharacterized protein LOC144653662 isoform X1 [Oculina patagonica]